MWEIERSGNFEPEGPTLNILEEDEIEKK